MFNVIKLIGKGLVSAMAIKAGSSLWDVLFEDKIREIAEKLRKKDSITKEL